MIRCQYFFCYEFTCSCKWLVSVANKNSNNLNIYKIIYTLQSQIALLCAPKIFKLIIIMARIDWNFDDFYFFSHKNVDTRRYDKCIG